MSRYKTHTAARLPDAEHARRDGEPVQLGQQFSLLLMLVRTRAIQKQLIPKQLRFPNLLNRLARFCVLYHGFKGRSALSGPKLGPSFRGLVYPLADQLGFRLRFVFPDTARPTPPRKLLAVPAPLPRPLSKATLLC